jgi:hypothetical protein
MGHGIQVGKLVYNVIEADWKGEVMGAKQRPKNRFLQLRLSVTNSAREEMGLPLLNLLDANGNRVPEYAEIESNSEWLGLVRRVQPTLTDTGAIYFDVPVGAYKLEVVDNSDPENEKVALVDIPASLAPPPAAGK